MKKPLFLPIPLHHPIIKVNVLVKQAAQIHERRKNEKSTKESNTQHQSLQFVCPSAVMLHYRANSEERDETGKQE